MNFTDKYSGNCKQKIMRTIVSDNFSSNLNLGFAYSCYIIEKCQIIKNCTFQLYEVLLTSFNKLL